MDKDLETDESPSNLEIAYKKLKLKNGEDCMEVKCEECGNWVLAIYNKKGMLVRGMGCEHAESYTEIPQEYNRPNNPCTNQLLLSDFVGF